MIRRRVPKMRPRQVVLLALLIFLTFCTYSIRRLTSQPAELGSVLGPDGTKQSPLNGPGAGVEDEPEPPRREPKPAPGGSHPIWHLITNAEREMEDIKERQSKTLEDAVAEYRRRYQIPPPPNFDKWYEFARKRGVQLIDEFDSVHELLTPFWGLKPATIRARAREALGFANQLMGFQLRQGKITNIHGGKEYKQEAVEGMMKNFVQYLPSMDLAFNIHDEPRVILQHADMARLHHTAKTVNMPAANSVSNPRNSFTQRPRGINDGSRLEEVRTTRFTILEHQPIWSLSRMSCPPESPARALEDADRIDAVGSYGLGELGFVYNTTAMSDICLSPSLRETYGFFDHPNYCTVVHDLFPIFSQSKLSSYGDLVYPSPWYWLDKVEYNEKKDMPWENKEDRLYWRGSTTGGYSRNGGWRRQHRQRLVQKINAADQAKILENTGDEESQNWQVKAVPRGDYKEIMDIHFSHVGQCDPGDCTAQEQFFEIAPAADQQEAWGYKYLLDIDGNAFSGRFHAFLKSKSLVYKWAIFREWHFEWLKPWVHFIPLSLQGDDWLESVRFFADRNLGKNEAERMAMQGRDWAKKVLRKEDMEVWFFRLLLEYGRVIDDDRDKIGFSLDNPRVVAE